MIVEKVSSFYSNLKRFTNKPSICHAQKDIIKPGSFRQILPPEKPEPITIDFIYKERHVLQELSIDFHNKIMELAKNKALTNITPNKNRVPRYLYHLTTQENYEKIIKNGHLEPQRDNICGNQIFLFDITNFCKHWNKKIYDYELNIQRKLVNWVSRRAEEKIVLLKIPTDTLKKDKLKMRSQEVLFSNSKILAIEQDNLLKKYNCTKLDELLDIATKNYTAFSELFDWYKRRSHIIDGAPAGLNKLFTQRKDAVEYFYPENINLENTYKIGEISVEKVLNNKQEVENIFLELLKNQPEKKNFTENKARIPALNKSSREAEFFGVTDPVSIQSKLGHHAILVLSKEKEKIISENSLTLNIDNLKENLQVTEKINKFIAELKKQGAARLSLESKIFGTNDSNIHTIGLVYDSNNNSVFIIDSLGKTSTTENYHKFLTKNIFNKENIFSGIIFSTKQQQKIDEYTCNNWTIANIEAVQKALRENKSIKSSKELNRLLPKDINKILKEQQEYVKREKDNYPSIFYNF